MMCVIIESLPSKGTIGLNRTLSHRTQRTVSYSIVSYHIASYSTVSYRIASYSTVSYHIASYSTVSYRDTASYWTYHIVQYCTVCIRPYCIIVTVLYRSMLYRNVQHRYYRTVSFPPFPSHRFYLTISQHNAPTNRFVQYQAYHTISQVLFHMNFILIAYLIGKFVKTIFFYQKPWGMKLYILVTHVP